ncbi:glycoside hydrolase family 127 protein [Kribbella capetownensis]|uniref:Glycoside hydrolase family 127 protein n=1 Tax=Kribbella capetownensis TaxID=1572659 RepID=A0A4R0K1Q3_9ACTN|nr:beta-L-arabinofuranosidase domain-containing protein [Kribbella capetownensis]TCC53881.1 glycoside hydrolase family 127 protein [Kribbella capetownensis]
MSATPDAVSTSRSPAAGTRGRWRPVGLADAKITGGFWSPRQQRNGDSAIPSGQDQLEKAGNLQNLRLAAGIGEGEAIGPVFADSDVYKWLEAAAWEYGRNPSEELLQRQRDLTAIVAAAQREDGYLDSVVQLRYGDEGRYKQLVWSHEHYCAGHLIQAAVAQVRCTGDRELLEVAIKLADHLVATFGDGKTVDVDGHPVIEMALVELYRETGTAAYLDLARWFVDARGHGIIKNHGHEPAYFSDRVPVREATTVEGHSVRAVYLAAGATDVAVETGDTELLEALKRQFAHMWSTKTYVTGGLGARWEGEAFGDEYELPSDRAYAETCAAIGGIQWAWRMLLATGEASYADAIERMLYNGFLAGVSLAGTEYFYVNALQLRGGAHADNGRSPAHGRRGWFDCACCPPNIMRTLASLDGYLASTSDGAIQIHQYVAGTLTAGEVTLTVETAYPWDGAVGITASGPIAVELRIPAWAEGATVNGKPVDAGTYAQVDAAAGDVIELKLPMATRVVGADPRVDAVRGCVALERGPLVYAVEQTDQEANVDDLHLLPQASVAASHDDQLLDGFTVLRTRGRAGTGHRDAVWPFATDSADGVGDEVDVVAVPYYAWANREIGAMRVWLPRG